MSPSFVIKDNVNGTNQIHTLYSEFSITRILLYYMMRVLKFGAESSSAAITSYLSPNTRHLHHSLQNNLAYKSLLNETASP